jgi:hypothetical protein
VLLKSRNFKNTRGGLTYVPVLFNVGYEYWDGQPAPESAMIAVPIAPPSSAPKSLPKPAATKAGGDMDDEIPF